MGALAVVENFLSPITQPLDDLSNTLGDMQTTHTDALDQFEQLLKDLQGDDPTDGFWSGTAAEDAVKAAGQYLVDARALSAPDMTVDLVNDATDTALDGMEDAAVDLAADVADDTVLTEVTTAVDVADVAQAGLDPITDAIGVILTAIDILLYMTAIAQFAWAVYQAIQTWVNAVNQAGSKPQPRLPSQPVALSETAKELARKYQADGMDIDAQTIQDMLDDGYTPDEIDEIIRNLKGLYGRKGVKDALNKLLALGVDPATVISITSIMARVGLKTLDPVVVEKLLTQQLGDGQTLTADEATEILQNLAAIYGAGNAPALTNAVNQLLLYNQSTTTTLDIVDSLKALYQNELSNRNSRYYQGSPRAAAATITDIINALTRQSINARPFNASSLQRHAQEHAAETGASSPQDYQQKAENFMNGAPDADEIEIRRANGEIIRYNLKTHEFGIVYSNGQLVTYYKVDKGSDAEDLDYVLSQYYKSDRS